MLLMRLVSDDFHSYSAEVDLNPSESSVSERRLQRLYVEGKWR